MKELSKVIGGIFLIFIAVWGFFYQYHIWPAPLGGAWWIIPQTITAAFIALVIGGIGGQLINDVVG